MFLLVGLGNPGNKYIDNRHNVGFITADKLVCRYKFSSYENKFNGLISSGNVDGSKIFVLKPQTFMNKSGVSVLKTSQFYKINENKIIVFYDDLDLPIGKVKVKIAGGSGGHNGIRSITNSGFKDYIKIRIGIGRPEFKEQVHSYVLSDFDDDQVNKINNVTDEIVNNIELVIENNLNEFMNKLHLNVSK